MQLHVKQTETNTHTQSRKNVTDRVTCTSIIVLSWTYSQMFLFVSLFVSEFLRSCALTR